jgi:probable addiction module antidote protein
MVVEEFGREGPTAHPGYWIPPTGQAGAQPFVERFIRKRLGRCLSHHWFLALDDGRQSLEEAGDDAAFVAKALGDIARAKGMTEVARATGLSRESLYKALSGERTPSLDTVLKVVAALGMRLHVEAAPVGE